MPKASCSRLLAGALLAVATGLSQGAPEGREPLAPEEDGDTESALDSGTRPGCGPLRTESATGRARRTDNGEIHAENGEGHSLGLHGSDCALLTRRAEEPPREVVAHDEPGRPYSTRM